MDTVKLALLRHLIEEGGATKRDSSQDLGITPNQFTHAIKSLRYDYNLDIGYDHRYKIYVLKSKQFPPGTRAVAEKLEEYNISGKNMLAVFERAVVPDFKPISIDTDSEMFTLPVVGDIHCMSKWSRRDLLNHFVDRCIKEDVDKVINTGDSIEGISNREGCWLDLADGGHTVDKQCAHLEDWFQVFSDAGIEVLTVEASRSHTNWSENKGNQGINTAVRLHKDVPSFTLVGLDEATIDIGGAKVMVRHPGGGSIRGNPLKKSRDHLDSLNFSDVPDVVLTGHYHKTGHQVHKGVHVVETGTLQDQTLFMMKNGIRADVGYTIIKMMVVDGRVRHFVPEFVTNFNRW